MKQLYYLLRGLSVGFILLFPASCPAQQDSLVDCFPLSVDNQWLYRFDHWAFVDYDPGSETTTDSGTSLLKVVGKIDYPDSVLWTFIEQRSFHHRVVLFVSGSFVIVDTTIIDSASFEVVELKSGRHGLYRRIRGSQPLARDTGTFWYSAFPFQRNMPDTARIYRYYTVDSSQTTLLTMKYEEFGLALVISLRKDSGLVSLSVGSTVTLWFEHTNHELVSGIIVDVVKPSTSTLPPSAHLAQSYPNPFNPTTQIEFDLSTDCHVTLTIHSLLGELIERLIDKRLRPSHYVTRFDASQLSSGVYIARLWVGDFTSSRKMVLIR